MSLLKKVNREKRIGICGGAGAARTPTYTPPYSSRVVISVHSYLGYLLVQDLMSIDSKFSSGSLFMKRA